MIVSKIQLQSLVFSSSEELRFLLSFKGFLVDPQVREHPQQGFQE